tara:strand:- start:8208 stop:9731 length:1524 start_codon:yes stop_codon:yes gene_type:complete
LNRTLAILTLFSLVLILLGVNRGFDISDEGLYVLLAVPDQENFAGIFNYDLFFKLFYKITGIEFGIIGLRLLRLILYGFGAYALTLFWRNLTNSKFSINIYFLSLAGLFAGYGFLPQSLSYNSISVVLSCFWLCLISKKDKADIHYIFMGILLASMLYVKITAVLGLGLLTLTSATFDRNFKWYQIVGLLAPFLIFEILLYSSLGDFLVSRLSGASRMMAARPDYSILLLFKYAGVGFFWIALTAIPFLIASRFQKSMPTVRLSLLGIAVFMLVIICYYTSITQEWNHIVLLLTVAILAYFSTEIDLKSISRNQQFLILVLLFLPFVLHFGSNVYWLRLGIHYWVFWILATFFLFEHMKFNLIEYVKLVVGLISLLLVLNGIWIHPFEQEPLWEADQKWNYSNEDYLFLSQNQILVLNAIKPLVEGEDQLLALYRIPGIPFLLNKTSPSSPGFWTKSQTEYFFPSTYQRDLLIVNSLDSLPSFVKNDYSTKYVQLPDSKEIKVLWRK